MFSHVTKQFLDIFFFYIFFIIQVLNSHKKTQKEQYQATDAVTVKKTDPRDIRQVKSLKNWVLLCQAEALRTTADRVVPRRAELTPSWCWPPWPGEPAVRPRPPPPSS